MFLFIIILTNNLMNYPFYIVYEIVSWFTGPWQNLNDHSPYF